MSRFILRFWLLAACGVMLAPLDAATRPNIVFILCDDLGWSDVGFHGGEIQSPHIDRLAARGVKLEAFYVQPVCSPTRAALMTGRYPCRHGLQVGVVRPWAQYGLPLDERTLPQVLQSVGYTTAICGKWHLGHFERAYLPTAQGFTHQYGHYNGAIDYFTHNRDGGFDWHRDDRVCRDEGYATTLLGTEAVRLIEAQDFAAAPLFLYLPFNAPHAPLQAMPEHLERYQHIADQKRRSYMAMVHAVDEQIGRVVAALEARGQTEQTLFVFSSDNGGPVNQGATNGPLRAGKGTLYEGGTRVAAFASWPAQLPAGTECREPLHMVDWYPTLATLTGASLDQPLPLDGRDIWPTLRGEAKSPHDAILINTSPTQGALRMGSWKLVLGGNLQEDIDHPRPANDPHRPPGKLELYDLANDPGETTNQAMMQPEIVAWMAARYERYALEAVPPKAAPKPPTFQSPAVWGE